jgi:CheY-like chemotaxis protein
VPAPRRILVVDDNEALRENLVEALELEGYQVEAVASGAAALASLARDPLPEVVLVDMLMPGMSGQELVATLRRDPRLAALRVALVTGLTPAREVLPVDAVLGKPFGVAELLGVVERLLAAGAAAAP